MTTPLDMSVWVSCKLQWSVRSGVFAIMVSQKCMLPPCLVSSTENCIVFSIKLMCCQNMSLHCLSCFPKSVIYISFPKSLWYSFVYQIHVLSEFVLALFVLYHKRVIYISFPKSWWVLSCYNGLVFKFLHVYVSYNGADWRTHGCSFQLFMVLPLEEELKCC